MQAFQEALTPGRSPKASHVGNRESKRDQIHLRIAEGCGFTGICSVGWRYDGMLCEAEDLDTGAMWECPLLIQLNRVPQHAHRQSEEAMRALGEKFHNLSAFSERTQEDTAKSPSAVAANDPSDYSKASFWLGAVDLIHSAPTILPACFVRSKI